MWGIDGCVGIFCYFCSLMSAENENNNSYSQDTRSQNSQDEQFVAPNPWVVFLHTLVNPQLGWRKFKKYKYKPEDFARSVFYPLLALMSVCRFADKLYYMDVKVAPLLQEAVAAFVAFFGGYYLIGIVARSFLPTVARTKIDTRFGQLYTMVIMSALTVSVILAEVLPWLGMLLAVPPLYCCYLLAKGIKCLRVPENEVIPTLILMIVLCIGVPSGIYFALTAVMPSA